MASSPGASRPQMWLSTHEASLVLSQASGISFPCNAVLRLCLPNRMLETQVRFFGSNQGAAMWCRVQFQSDDIALETHRLIQGARGANRTWQPISVDSLNSPLIIVSLDSNLHGERDEGRTPKKRKPSPNLFDSEVEDSDDEEATAKKKANAKTLLSLKSLHVAPQAPPPLDLAVQKDLKVQAQASSVSDNGVVFSTPLPEPIEAQTAAALPSAKLQPASDPNVALAAPSAAGHPHAAEAAEDQQLEATMQDDAAGSRDRGEPLEPMDVDSLITKPMSQVMEGGVDKESTAEIVDNARPQPDNVGECVLVVRERPAEAMDDAVTDQEQRQDQVNIARPSSSEPLALTVGMKARVEGLQSEKGKGWNGRLCTVIELSDAPERLMVKMDGDGVISAIKKNNLIAVPSVPSSTALGPKSALSQFLSFRDRLARSSDEEIRQLMESNRPSIERLRQGHCQKGMSFEMHARRAVGDASKMLGNPCLPDGGQKLLKLYSLLLLIDHHQRRLQDDPPPLNHAGLSSLPNPSAQSPPPPPPLHKPAAGEGPTRGAQKGVEDEDDSVLVVSERPAEAMDDAVKDQEPQQDQVNIGQPSSSEPLPLTVGMNARVEGLQSEMGTGWNGRLCTVIGLSDAPDRLLVELDGEKKALKRVNLVPEQVPVPAVVAAPPIPPAALPKSAPQSLPQGHLAAAVQVDVAGHSLEQKYTLLKQGVLTSQKNQAATAAAIKTPGDALTGHPQILSAGQPPAHAPTLPITVNVTCNTVKGVLKLWGSPQNISKAVECKCQECKRKDLSDRSFPAFDWLHHCGKEGRQNWRQVIFIASGVPASVFPKGLSVGKWLELIGLVVSCKGWRAHTKQEAKKKPRLSEQHTDEPRQNRGFAFEPSYPVPSPLAATTAKLASFVFSLGKPPADPPIKLKTISNRMGEIFESVLDVSQADASTLASIPSQSRSSFFLQSETQRILASSAALCFGTELLHNDGIMDLIPFIEAASLSLSFPNCNQQYSLLDIFPLLAGSCLLISDDEAFDVLATMPDDDSGLVNVAGSIDDALRPVRIMMLIAASKASIDLLSTLSSSASGSVDLMAAIGQSLASQSSHLGPFAGRLIAGCMTSALEGSLMRSPAGLMGGKYIETCDGLEVSLKTFGAKCKETQQQL